jgi:hypothetical protein
MGKADESMYAMKIAGMSELVTSDSPRTGLSTSLNDSNYLHTTSVKRKRRKESDSNNETTLSPNSKRFNNSNENNDGLDDDVQVKVVNVKKDSRCLIAMEIRDTERNYVTMLGNIIKVSRRRLCSM